MNSLANIPSNLFSNQTAEAVTIFVLLLIILLCFFKYALFRNKTEQKGVQKIIGGLSVFIVALLSHDIYVQMVSLFIGGLIIASEEFMQNLAIIVRSASGDIGKNLSASHPTNKEIEEKKQKEVADVKQIDKSKRAVAARYDTITVESLENVERQVGRYFRDKYVDKFEQNVKITSPNGYEFVADGLVRDADGGIEEIIEVKHIPDIKFAQKSLSQTASTLEQLLSYVLLTICFVVDDSPDEKKIIELINESKKLKNITLGVFEIRNGRVKILLEP